MKKILLSLLMILLISCESNDSDEVSLIKTSEPNLNKALDVSSVSFGTIDPISGEFISIDNDTSTLGQSDFPYIDSYNVAFYDDSYLLYDCPNNGRQCVDLSHFIGKYILPIESRAIPVYYGEYNSDFNNLSGSVNERIFTENGYQDLLVTHSWMTDYASNTVLNIFRAEIKNNYQLKNIKAFNIYTKEYFGPSRQVIVKIKNK